MRKLNVILYLLSRELKTGRLNNLLHSTEQDIFNQTTAMTLLPSISDQTLSWSVVYFLNIVSSSSTDLRGQSILLQSPKKPVYWTFVKWQ